VLLDGKAENHLGSMPHQPPGGSDVMMEGDLFIFPLFWSRHDYHARFKKILPSSTPPSILPKTYPYQQLQLTDLHIAG